MGFCPFPHCDIFTARFLYCFQCKESDAARLAEELGASKAREAELESRLNNEMLKLAEQIEDLQDRHKAEVITHLCQIQFISFTVNLVITQVWI